MNFAEFQQFITAFADTKADLDINKGVLLVQVRGEVIEATIRQSQGEIVVDDDLSTGMPARTWVITRVAKLPQLADRIVDTLPSTQPFICPSGRLEDFDTGSTKADHAVDDAVKTMSTLLDTRLGGTTSILYLTSEAGEGKTTIINELARERAHAYKRKETDWLLLPVTLGGRTFMRFDDIVIAELVNRFRFPFFYYDGFLELVRLGVIVPAFDGFEEMFVEGSTGEALSALGTLVRSLNSSGSVLIAARKAYFEFQNLGTRTQLFDAIRGNAVTFARLKLERWSRSQFLAYANARQIPNADDLYEAISTRMGADHALLTRAVLVKRLLDVAESHESLGTLLSALGSSPADYFHEFVETLLAREVEKWIDRQGEAARPLLTIEQHEELLGFVAQEMWLSGTDVLRKDTLDVVTEIFCELHGIGPTLIAQIKERLPQHALLTNASQGRDQYMFDHEDFRRYFLGEALGRAVANPGTASLHTLLKVGALPEDTSDAIVRYLARTSIDEAKFVRDLVEIGSGDLHSSFTRENCGALIIRLLDGSNVACEISDIAFPSDALRERTIERQKFIRCYFRPTTLINSKLIDVEFNNCQLDGVELSPSSRVSGTLLRDCEIRSVSREDGSLRTFDPDLVDTLLSQAGFQFPDQAPPSAAVEVSVEPDEKLALVERLLRAFLRNTQVNEDALRKRFGTRANLFFNEVMPQLRKLGVMEDVLYLGAGQQQRFRLALPMWIIERSIAASDGTFESFLEKVQSLKP